MRGALDVHHELLARDVPHEVVRLRGRLLSADDLPGALGLEQGCVVVRCWVVDRRGRSGFAAVLVPAGAVPERARLLAELSADAVRPARPDEVNAATDFPASLVCPVGLPPEVEVLADAAVLGPPTSYCAVGEGGVALGIRTSDLLAVSGARTARLVDGAAPPPGPARTIELDPPRGVRTAPGTPPATGAAGASRRDVTGSSDVL